MNRLIPAYKKGKVLLAEMDALLDEADGFRLWWLGQSGYLLQWQGIRVLIDPYLSDSLTKKYSATAKPHIRMSELVVNPGLLRNISVVSSSHNHTDHLDAETLVPLIKNNPGMKLIVPEANRHFVADRVQCDPGFPTGLNDGVSVTFQGITYIGVPAKHNELARDDQGNCLYLGYVIRFGDYTIYHSGDTLWFDKLVELLAPFQVDVALLPINGNWPERKVAGNLDHVEAVALGRAIGAGCVIPCHYEMFTFNTADVAEFVLEAEKMGQPHRVLRGGECYHHL